MKAQNEQLNLKLGFLQKPHLDELAENDKIKQELQTRVGEMETHIADQKLLVGIIKEQLSEKLVFSYRTSK